MFSFQQWIYPVFFCLLAHTQFLHAQEIIKELPKEIIESKADPQLQKPELLKVISKEEINKDTPYLSQVLKRVNGIRVNESGGIGQFSTALFRGSSSQQVKIYKNGIPVTESRYGTIDLSKISLANVESIEIYKGFVPAYLGSSNMGAAINIITSKENESTGISGGTSLSYGSFNSFLFSTNISEVTPKHQISFNVDFVDAKNNYQFHNNKGTPYNANDDSLDHKSNNAYQELNFQNEFTKVYENFQLTTNFNSKNNKQELGGPQNANTKEVTNTNNENSFSTAFQNKTSEHFHWETTLFSSANYNQLLDPLGELGFSPDQNSNKLYTLGNKSYLNWKITDNFYTNYLFEPKIEFDKKIDQINNQDSYWKRNSVVLTFEPGLKVWQEKLEIKAGISSLINSDTVNIFGKTEKNNTTSLFNYQISSKYISDTNNVFKTSLGQATRAPSLFELFGDTGQVVGNQQLKEESTLFGEISWDRSINFQRLNLISNFSITGFVKEGSNLISYQQISAGIARPFNIEKTFISGIETEVLFNHPYLDFLFQYTFTDAKNKSNSSYKQNKNLPGIPQNKFLSEITFKIREWKCFYRLNYSSKEYFDEINLIYEKDRIIQDLGISYNYKKWQFNLECKNMMDKQYEDFVNYPLPGRSFWLKINYQF